MLAISLFINSPGPFGIPPGGGGGGGPPPGNGGGGGTAPPGGGGGGGGGGKPVMGDGFTAAAAVAFDRFAILTSSGMDAPAPFRTSSSFFLATLSPSI